MNSFDIEAMVPTFYTFWGTSGGIIITVTFFAHTLWGTSAENQLAIVLEFIRHTAQKGTKINAAFVILIIYRSFSFKPFTTRYLIMKRRNQFWIELSLSICLLISITAVADVKVNRESQTVFNQAQDHHAVGDKIIGNGIVFFVDGTGEHGLVAKSSDEMGTMIWSDAVAAAEAVGLGWRLPTSTELLSLYTHRKLIGGFSNEDYWSATEQDVNSAWIQGFRTGDQDRYNKDSKLRVRAVRAF